MTGAWPKLLGGLVVWAAHFLTLYAIGEWGAERAAERWAVLGASLVALSAIGWLLLKVARDDRDTQFDRWRRSTSLLGIGLAAIAIIWQTLPAAF